MSVTRMVGGLERPWAVHYALFARTGFPGTPQKSHGPLHDRLRHKLMLALELAHVQVVIESPLRQ
jgi:hypothetical protein